MLDRCLKARGVCAHILAFTVSLIVRTTVNSFPSTSSSPTLCLWLGKKNTEYSALEIDDLEEKEGKKKTPIRKPPNQKSTNRQQKSSPLFLISYEREKCGLCVKRQLLYIRVLFCERSELDNVCAACATVSSTLTPGMHRAACTKKMSLYSKMVFLY